MQISAITQQIFFEDFQKFGQLGSGAVSKVYLVRHKRTSNIYALKVMSFLDYEKLAQGVNELILTRSIDDQAIPKIYSYFFRKENIYKPHQFCLVMEHCHMSLENYIKERKNKFQKVLLQDTWQCLKTMTRVLAKMQRKNILHRDIKPGNILVNVNYVNNYPRIKECKLSDFGFSTYNTQRSHQTITGTIDYVSPRVHKKFLNTNINIAGINFKDQVFSLGKIIVQMMIKKNIPNQSIDQQFFFKLQKNLKGQKFPYLSSLIHLLRKMLQFDENQRFDSIQLEKQIQKIQNKTIISVYDVDNQRLENNELSNMGFSQNSTPRYYSQTNQVLQSQIQINIGQSQKLTKKKNYKIKQTADYDGETRYLANQEEQLNNQRKQLFLRKKLIDFCSNQIYCMKVIGDYALLGMNSRLGVMPLKQLNKNKHVYLLKLKALQSFRDLFKIKNIQISKNHIFLLLDKSEFLYIKIQTFLGFIDKLVVKNHEQQIKNGIFKEVCKKYFPSNKNFDNIYELSYNQFSIVNLTQQNEEITCIQILQNSFCGFENANIIGYANGSVKVNSKVIYKLKQKINQIKVLNENKLIFTTPKQIHIVEIVKTDSSNSQTQYLKKIHSFISQTEIVYFRIVHRKKINQQKQGLIPLVEVFTKNSTQYILGQKLQLISQNRLELSSQIKHVTQTQFNWSVEKKKTVNIQNHVVQIKKITKFSSNDSLFCYLSSQGWLKYAHSRERLCPINFQDVVSYQIYADKIIICKSNGLIQIFYPSYEPKNKKELKSRDQTQKSTQSTNHNSRVYYNQSQMNESIKQIDYMQKLRQCTQKTAFNKKKKPGEIQIINEI